MPIRNVLHLSHTDINYDSRILKEMIALSETGQYVLHGLGVAKDEGNVASVQSKSLQIDSIHLKSRGFKSLPVFMRHALSLIELTIKMSIKAIKIRPNVIHVHDTLVLHIGVILKLIISAKLIYDAHELESDRNGLTRILSKVIFIMEKILWRFVDHLIVVSPSIQKWYKDNIGAKPSGVILNSPVFNVTEKQTCRFGKNYLRQKYNIAETKKIFIYVGIFGKGRGIENIIDVFSDIQESHLVLIGYGELTEWIKKQVNTHVNIHLHPAVPHDDVVDVTRSADVGLCMIGNVSLSDYYCLPNKLFEYCFAGVPVIASDFPDIMNVVTKFKLGLCCGQSKESIKNAVELFINNKVDNQIHAEKLTELSWVAQKVKLLNVYECVSSLQ